MRILWPGLLLALLLPAAATGSDDEFAPARATLQTCFACHGERGAAPLPQNPILAGQEYYYLYVQLKDFKSGLRKNEIMGPTVQTLQPEELKLIARYFSLQSWPATSRAPDPAKAEIARAAVEAGECVACHLGDFRGNSRVPRLAGQTSDYLSRTMLDFKNRVRNNAPDKGALLATFSEQDLLSLADYLASVTVYQSSQGSEIQ